MKKMVAVGLTLMLLFSFAMAETGTEAVIVNFREKVGEETLSAGTYTQLGNLSMHVWIPNDAFTEMEVPKEEEYEETVMILSYNANPDLEIFVESAETDISIDELLANLSDPENGDVFTEVESAVVNGINCISYYLKNDDGSQTKVAEYFIENCYVRIFFPNSDDVLFNQYATMLAVSIEII